MSSVEFSSYISLSYLVAFALPALMLAATWLRNRGVAKSIAAITRGYPDES